MSAVIVYGHEFESDELIHNERTYLYLRPIDGDSFAMSYSSLEELKEYCRRFGAADADWPDYIETGGYDIPVPEMLERNRRLKNRLGKLTTEDVDAVPWLAEIVGLLREGYSFYIH